MYDRSKRYVAMRSLVIAGREVFAGQRIPSLSKSDGDKLMKLGLIREDPVQPTSTVSVVSSAAEPKRRKKRKSQSSDQQPAEDAGADAS